MRVLIAAEAFVDVTVTPDASGYRGDGSWCSLGESTLANFESCTHGRGARVSWGFRKMTRMISRALSAPLHHQEAPKLAFCEINALRFSLHWPRLVQWTKYLANRRQKQKRQRTSAGSTAGGDND